MMYESPINIMLTQLRAKQEDEAFRITKSVAQSMGVNIDKDELIKALKYDRQQYEKGYQDGMEAATKWVSADVNLPDRSGKYLVFSGIVLVAWYRKGSGQWEMPGGLVADVNDKVITHWRPLPKGPEVCSNETR